MTGHDVQSRHGISIVFEAVGRARLCDAVFLPPGPGMVRVAVHGSGLCHREFHVLHGRIPRSFPSVMGHEPVGVIDAVGEGVTSYCPGQIVSGIGESSLASFEKIPAEKIVLLRSGSDFMNKLVEPVMCVVNAVNRASLKSDSMILINGLGFMGRLLLQTVRAKAPDAFIVAVEPRSDCRSASAGLGANMICHDLSLIGPLLPRAIDVSFETSGVAGTVAPVTTIIRNGGTLALFAHHFLVEPSAVNDWHMRGITVLNTVPWAAPNLIAELREAGDMLNSGAISLTDGLVKIVDPNAAIKALEHGPCAGEKYIVKFF